MRKICFDDIIYSLQPFGGATTYWVELTNRIETMLPNQVEHVTGRTISRLFKPNCSSKIFHSSHFRVSGKHGVSNIGTIYDLNYELGLVGGLGYRLNLLERKRCIEKCDALICISESTKQDLLAFYGSHLNYKPIFVIHLGPSIDIQLCTLDDGVPDLATANGWDGYYLYVGGRSGYKNFQVALMALKNLNIISKFRMGIICTGSMFSAEERRSIADAGLTDLVKCKYIESNSEMHRHYRSAIALVYPSSYEGFGLPVLDAMSTGCPVVASNASSIPEISQGAALLSPPGDPEALSASMYRLLDDLIRDECIKSGYRIATKFSWDQTAAKHMELYDGYL